MMPMSAGAAGSPDPELEAVLQNPMVLAVLQRLLAQNRGLPGLPSPAQPPGAGSAMDVAGGGVPPEMAPPSAMPNPAGPASAPGMGGGMSPIHAAAMMRARRPPQR